VLTAVRLDAELSLDAVEVQDVAAALALPAELGLPELPVSKMLPEQALRV
jgi:hypothetical protein